MKRGGVAYEVSDNGCWNFLGSLTPLGYGHLCRNKKFMGAHRYFYELRFGPIPKGLQLDHLCRNPTCVNPEHLEPVTNAENTRRGKKAKLNTEAVKVIKYTMTKRMRMARDGFVRKLAALHGVNESEIYRVVENRRWA
jgi:hypothetical protein